MIIKGYSEEGYHAITVTFPAKGTFLLSGLDIWHQLMKGYMKEIDKLQKEKEK